MAKTGLVTSIRPMTYQPAERGAAAVETMSLDRLRVMNDGGTQRADFHVLALIDAGHGSVTVDFARHLLEPHSAVWIAPGVLTPHALTSGSAGHRAHRQGVYIVDRIVLEAKRILVHDRLTAANCATALGFLDASNFSVFFRNATGTRPGAWQAMSTGK